MNDKGIKTEPDLIPPSPPPCVARIIPRDTEGVRCYEHELDAARAEIEKQGGRVIEEPRDLGEGWKFIYGVQILEGE